MIDTKYRVPSDRALVSCRWLERERLLTSIFHLAKIGLTSRYLPLNHNGKCCPKYNAILDASTNTILDLDSD